MILIEEKIERVKNLFSPLDSQEKRYQQLIRLGAELLPFEEIEKVESNRVTGCQSLMYLSASFKDGLIFFKAASDALISKGLAALLISVYSGVSAEIILTHQPLFLHEIGIIASLTPSRSNGLASLHLKMKQHAMQFIKITSS